MPTGKPDLFLVGYGVADTIQLTVESQRALTRVGTVFAISMPPNLERFVRALGVRCVDVGPRFGAYDSFADAYLDIAEAVLRKADEDPPVALLSPGNPLLSNALARYLVILARERGLTVQALPAVSPLDVFICLTAIDIGTFGLQVFDARRVVGRAQAVDPSVPLLLLQLAGLGAATPRATVGADPNAYRPLVGHLARFYPPAHPVTHLTDGSGGAAGAETVPLARLVEIASRIEVGSMLFIDRVLRRAGSPSPPRQ